MSKKQWGHGYWKGFEDAQKDKKSLVGLYYHSFTYGGSKCAGIIKGALDNQKYIVTDYFGV